MEESSEGSERLYRECDAAAFHLREDHWILGGAGWAGGERGRWEATRDGSLYILSASSGDLCLPSVLQS